MRLQGKYYLPKEAFLKTYKFLFLAIIIFLSACTATEPIPPTASATITASATATEPPLPTATQTPIPATATTTITPTPAPFSALEEISLQYLAKSDSDATTVAHNLAYLTNGAHASNMCGPLAATILREGGVISPYTKLYDFWLLNPRTHQETLKNTFPKSRFDLTEIRTPILDYDFSENPLQAGDFLYLYAGPNGNFEHMFTVTRVDEEGRPYTVTNLNTDEGYIIDEFMLYDPNAPEEGLIYRWNNRDYDDLGLTGSGGFDLWRPKTIWDSGDPALTASINDILDNAGGEWHIFIKELDGEILYTRNLHKITHIASTIKVPLALLFMQAIQEESGDIENYLASHAYEGRSYEQIISAMLVESEEPATGAIYQITLKNGLNMPLTLENWGIEETDIPYRTSTMYDLSLILEGLYRNTFVSEEKSQYILDLMGVYTENDDSRLGLLKEDFPQAKIYNKRGTLTNDFLVVGDAAIVEIDEKTYLIMIVGNQDEAHSVNNSDLENTLEDIVAIFGDYLLSEE